MERWCNKIAIVTGASGGIGAAITKDLVRAGVITIGLARRADRVEALRNDLPAAVKKNLYGAKCDVTKDDEIKNVFKWVKDKFGGIDILVNNAGIVRPTELLKPGNSEDMRALVDTNVLGVIHCTREAFSSMKDRDVQGHVVIINSIVGHAVPNLGDTLPSLNVYPATKYAVTALAETYRQEFRKNGNKVKITSISPGATDTEIFPTESKGSLLEHTPLLRAEDVSNAIMYAIGTPPNVQIHEITIRPLGEKF